MPGGAGAVVGAVAGAVVGAAVGAAVGVPVADNVAADWPVEGVENACFAGNAIADLEVDRDSRSDVGREGDQTSGADESARAVHSSDGDVAGQVDDWREVAGDNHSVAQSILRTSVGDGRMDAQDTHVGVVVGDSRSVARKNRAQIAL